MIKFLIRDTYFKRTKLVKINKERRNYKKNVSKWRKLIDNG